MLISCDRHTPQDIDCWNDYEESDYHYASFPTLQKRVNRSIRAIEEFLLKGRCYLAISGGKDSAVVSHLLSQITKTVPVRWLATEPLVDPYCRETIQEIVSYCGFSNYREHINWCRLGDREWHATGTLEEGIKSIQKEVGTLRYITGIRAQESVTRRLRCFQHLENSLNTCAPLAWWKTEDVYAYAAINNVPLHPTYGMLGGGRWKREKLRVSFLSLTHGTGGGRTEWEKEYYGDFIRKIYSGFIPENYPYRENNNA